MLSVEQLISVSVTLLEACSTAWLQNSDLMKFHDGSHRVRQDFINALFRLGGKDSYYKPTCDYLNPFNTTCAQHLNPLLEVMANYIS